MSQIHSGLINLVFRDTREDSVCTFVSKCCITRAVVFSFVSKLRTNEIMPPLKNCHKICMHIDEYYLDSLYIYNTLFYSNLPFLSALCTNTHYIYSSGYK